jgi:hypothetical protein
VSVAVSRKERYEMFRKAFDYQLMTMQGELLMHSSVLIQTDQDIPASA